jgi:hypothetical protein
LQNFNGKFDSTQKESSRYLRIEKNLYLLDELSNKLNRVKEKISEQVHFLKVLSEVQKNKN